MPDSASATRRSRRSQEAAVASLAKETQTPPDVVKRLYDEEVAALEANAKVGSFIGVIAGRRVKKRLMGQASNGRRSREADTDRRSP